MTPSIRSGRSGDTLKISGKRFALPEDAALSEWNFELRPGGWIIATSPTGERLRFSSSETRQKLGFAFPKGASGYGEVIPKAHGAHAGSGTSSAAQIAAELTAQFPGKVRKILVAAGARVSAGESLVLVEAMKMEFAVKAPVDGQVVALLVHEGQQLQPGDRLLDFSASAPDGGSDA